ncbi:MAG TPA: hypothetical protein VK922_12360 [Gemmatimonadaceae bacterium]|nr:hypothetical protein [Gemmatimonadaceae bacterium]
MARLPLVDVEPPLSRALLIAGGLAIAACSDDIFQPNVDCANAIGAVFIELQPPEPAGMYGVSVGDSIRVTGALRRVDASEPTFNPQQGWSCSTAASSAIGGTVAFTTADTVIVRLLTDGWIRGRQAGFALVTAASASPAATETFGVVVTSP